MCVCVCACLCLHACVCGKSAKVAGKGEATEFTTALTWWQMKIKRLLLKMGGVSFQMCLRGHVQDKERAMARNEGWALRRRGRARRHRAGLREQDGLGGGYIFGRTTKRSRFFFSHKTRVAKCHDSADRGRKRDREWKTLSERWPRVIELWNVALLGLHWDQHLNRGQHGRRHEKGSPCHTSPSSPPSSVTHQVSSEIWDCEWVR